MWFQLQNPPSIYHEKSFVNFSHFQLTISTKEYPLLPSKINNSFTHSLSFFSLKKTLTLFLIVTIIPICGPVFKKNSIKCICMGKTAQR